MTKKRTLFTLMGAGILAGAAVFSISTFSTKETDAMTHTAEINQFLSTPHFLNRPEGRIAYDDQGTGPLFIMVPGLGDMRAEYRMVAPKLVDAGYRVVTMDLRGHGQSSTGWSDYSSSALGSDVEALAEHLDAGPAILVGDSMGAAAVAWAAADAPQQVSRLALIGPFVRAETDTTWWQNLIMGAMIKLGLNGPWAPAMWGKFYGSLYGTKPDDFDSYQKALVASFKQPGRMDALRGMMAVTKADVAARLHEIKAPVLIFMGTADPDFPDPQKEAEIVAGLLNGSVEMVEGAGHYPQVEDPDLVATKLAGFAGPAGES
jgi:pimeloyl-ACP methyl ester carboxylesterase